MKFLWRLNRRLSISQLTTPLPAPPVSSLSLLVALVSSAASRSRSRSSVPSPSKLVSASSLPLLDLEPTFANDDLWRGGNKAINNQQLQIMLWSYRETRLQ